MYGNMVTVIKKWGNSLTLRIPKSLARGMHLSSGSLVEMTVVNGELNIKPVGQRKTTLSKMLKSITKNNQHSEQNCNGSSGREIL